MDPFFCSRLERGTPFPRGTDYYRVGGLFTEHSEGHRAQGERNTGT